MQKRAFLMIAEPVDQMLDVSAMLASDTPREPMPVFCVHQVVNVLALQAELVETLQTRVLLVDDRRHTDITSISVVLSTIMLLATATAQLIE
jgi:hypothetical protein